MKNTLNQFNIYKSKSVFFLVSSIPLFLIFSRFVSDLFVVILSLLFIIFFSQFKKDFNFFFRKDSFLFLIYFIYLLISVIFSHDPSTSFQRGSFYFRFFIFSIFLSIYFINIDQKLLDNFFKIILLIVLLQSIYNIVEFLFIQLKQNNLVFSLGNFKFEYRVKGFFNDVRSGSYLSKFSVISIFWLYSKYNLTWRIFILNLILFLGLLVTGERSSIIFLFLCLFFCLIFISSYRKFIFKNLIILFLLSVSILISFPHYKARMIDSTLYVLGLQNLITEKNKFEAYHIAGGTALKEIDSFLDSHHGAHFLTAVEIWKDYKVFGSGIKTFRLLASKEKYSNINSTNKHLRSSTHPHNYYLEILSELGLAGIFIFFLFIVNFIVKILIIKNAKDNFFYVPAFVCLTILWPLKTTGSFFNNWESVMFWTIYGISVGLINRNLKIINS